jgi:DNA-binding CsgD family transcriptional regulator
MYKECLGIIEQVEKGYSRDLLKNKKLEADFKNLLGRNYLVLGFKDQAVKTLRKELDLAQTLEPIATRNEVQIRAYMTLAACYQGNDKDSIYYYLNKIRPVLSEGPEQSLFYYNLAHYHMHHTHNLDSSFYYNDKGLGLDSLNSFKYISFGLIQKAHILFKKQRYSSSLDTCLETLPIVNRQKRLDYVLELYSLMASNYKMLGDDKKQAEYLSRLTHLRDSVVAVRKKAIETASNIMINTEVESFRKEKKKTAILAAIVGLGILVLVLLKVRDIQRRKNNLLVLKETEVQTLENRLQYNVYEEVVYLAKNNSVEFLCRFQELYPNFVSELLEIDPSLQNTEITFCAYLKLNFSTKEIAMYTFVTPKAVQNRKNRIRKKLNIPSEEDINVWIGRIG